MSMNPWTHEQDPDFVDLRRAAEVLGVTQKFLKTSVKDGSVPCLHVSGRMLFNIEQVRKVLLDRAAAAARQATQGEDAEVIS